MRPKASKMPKSKALPITKTSAKANNKAKANDGAGTTRRAILDLLKRQGPSSSAALGEALGVTPMAARLQLYELEADGLVACDARAAAPGQRGRPVKYWTLTGDADRVFPDAHQGLAVEMINSVREIFGEEGMKSSSSSMATSSAKPMARASPAQRASASGSNVLRARAMMKAIWQRRKRTGATGCSLKIIARFAPPQKPARASARENFASSQTFLVRTLKSSGRSIFCRAPDGALIG